eukprot:m.17051 g.17051  ORF g.17051 m.17051 type:complete len:663 (+) comp7033_c2_seq1:26-2014(+)
MAEGSSLLSYVREEIFTNVIKTVQKGKDENWLVMVVDSVALRLVSTCCRMTEIVEAGVTIVEALEKSRKPLLEFEAIYLVAPTLENAKMIVADFALKPKYRKIHIFFLDTCPDDVLRETAPLKRVIATCKELSLNFHPAESHVFTLDRPAAIWEAYSKKSSGENIGDIASQIACVCATLGESPIVRYQAGGRPANSKLALLVQQRLDLLRTYNSRMMASASSKKRSQLLILDRNFDLISPLVHELTYQAAAYDLLDIKGNVYSFKFDAANGQTTERKATLDESDEVWVKQRHNHLSVVSENVNVMFREFKKKHEVELGSASSSQMKNLVQSMPQRRSEFAQFSLHLDMATAINKAFSRKIEMCTRVEQNIVMGEDEDGVKIKDYIGQIASVLVDRGISMDNKLRAMMLMVLSLDGLKPNEMQQLFDTSNIPYTRRGAITNLEDLGAVVDSAAQGKKKLKKFKRTKRDFEFKLSRWVPIIKDLMEDAIKNKLSTDDFPATKESAGLGAAAEADDDDEEEVASARKRGGWAKTKQKTAAAAAAEPRGKGGKGAAAAASLADRPRLIVYITGSVSLNEMRSAYEVSKAFPDWDVYIGSGTILKPTSFLDCIEALDSEKPFNPEKGHDDDDDGAIRVVAGSAAPSGGAAAAAAPAKKGGRYAEQTV